MSRRLGSPIGNVERSPDVYLKCDETEGRRSVTSSATSSCRAWESSRGRLSFSQLVRIFICEHSLS